MSRERHPGVGVGGGRLADRPGPVGCLVVGGAGMSGHHKWTAPGDVVHAVYDHGGRDGYACVLETSMHKAVYDEAAARSEIANHYDDEAEMSWEFDTWFSVLASDCEVGDVAPGGWHTNGTGARWVKVLVGFDEATS